MIRRIANSGTKIRHFMHVPKAMFFQQHNFDSSKDYYLVLGISKNASETQIKNAYYRLAKAHHPDVNKGQDTKFKQISEAYEVLSDPEKRRSYDSSQTFGDFANNFKGKASQGSTNYQEYQQFYENLSPEQRQQVAKQMRVRLRNVVLVGLGFIIFWNIFTRRPAQHYQEINGNLIPIMINPMINPYENYAQYPQGQQMQYQPQPHSQSPYNYGSPYTAATPAYNYNPNPSQGGYQHQYFPTRSQNNYQPGTMQSNYTPQYQTQAPQQAPQ